MNLDDLKDKLHSLLHSFLEKIQESSLYLQLRDRYENLTPAGQKISLILAVIVGFLFLISFPWVNFNSSQVAIQEFEERRSLIRDLYRVTQESSSTPQIPVPPDVNTLRSRIQNELQLARLLPEQINEADVTNEPSGLIPENWLQGTARVSLSKLNLRQIVDIGYQLTAISPSVKMKDLVMHANSTDSRYFDVIYKLAILKVPELKTVEEKEESPAPKKKVRK